MARRRYNNINLLSPPFDDSLQWSWDASEIFFNHGPEVHAVTVDGSRLRRIAKAWTDTPDGEVAGRETAFNVAPDGLRLIYTSCEYPRPSERPRPEAWEHQPDLVVARLNGAQGQRLTTSEALESYPVWSPDGIHIAYVVLREPLDEESSLYVRSANGNLKRMLQTGVAYRPPAWSPDGRWLAVTGVRGGNAGRRPLYLVAMPEGSTAGSRTIRLSDAVSGASWSPDGERLAFAKSDGRDVALFTIAADGTDLQRVTTITGWPTGTSQNPIPTRTWIQTVAWSPDGSKILFSCSSGICVIEVNGKSVGRSPRRIAREIPLAAAWSPDGTRIAISVGRKSQSSTNLVIYTMAPDGTNRRTLVVQDDGGTLQSLGARPREDPVDVTGCAGGRAVPAPTANPGLVHDCETLLGLRDALAGSAGLNWSADRAIGDWEGIVVDGSPLRVTEITIQARALWGVIPPALSELEQLRVLQLGWNGLGGSIPPELGLLMHLRELGLSNNYLGGSIPAELRSLRSLTELHLDFNDLNGPIPPQLGEMTDLVELHLGFNDLAGPIPSELGRLSKLRGLSLWYGNLGGTIPAEFGKLASLESLTLMGNHLTGEIPAELGRMRNLMNLDLSDNQLTGPIPAELGQLGNLGWVRIGGNSLTGCIPPALLVKSDNDLSSLRLPTCEPG